MSTVKATNFQHPSASAAGITLGSDGSVVLPSGFTGGLGTNVVQTVKTDTFTTTSTSYTDVTGLSVTITPTSATSKVLIVGMLSMSAGDNVHVHAKLLRGSTDILIGDAASNRVQATTNVYGGFTSGAVASIQNMAGNFAITTVDSPATTSATTYKVQIRTGGAGTGAINRSGADTDTANMARTVSSLVAIEVAA